MRSPCSSRVIMNSRSDRGTSRRPPSTRAMRSSFCSGSRRILAERILAQGVGQQVPGESEFGKVPGGGGTPWVWVQVGPSAKGDPRPTLPLCAGSDSGNWRHGYCFRERTRRTAPCSSLQGVPGEGCVVLSSPPAAIRQLLTTATRFREGHPHVWPMTTPGLPLRRALFVHVCYHLGRKRLGPGRSPLASPWSV